MSSTAAPAPTPTLTTTLAWVGPFAVFMGWLALDKYLPIANPGKEILRDTVLVVALFGFSRRVIPTKAPHWLPSILLGLAVCALWIAPDLLIPGWRSSVIFQNSITGHLKTSIPPSELTPLMLVLRTMRAALLVPIIEELFWRGWLVRWLQNNHFERVPIGQFTALAFWVSSLLFAAEHGPYWEVGLLCGMIFNWWLWRTKSLGDVIVVHGVTNLALSLYIIATKRWEFWM